MACLEICAAGEELLALASKAKVGLLSDGETFVAGVNADDVIGVKEKLLDEVVAGVKSAFVNPSAFMFGVEAFVRGVYSLFSFAIGDQFSSPSIQLSLSGLDLTAFDMPLFAFCEVRSGDGV